MTKKPSLPQTETSVAITTKQYDLFTTFFGNPNNLSNTIELWDAIPKYAVNERAQSQVRDEKGNLPVSTQEFLYRPTVRGLPKEITCKLTIQPAIRTRTAPIRSITLQTTKNYSRKSSRNSSPIRILGNTGRMALKAGSGLPWGWFNKS